MSTLSHVIDAVRPGHRHADERRELRDSYAHALSGQHEMAEDIDRRRAEIAAELEETRDVRTEARLAEEDRRLTILQQEIAHRIEAFEHRVALLADGTAEALNVLIDRAVTEAERADREPRHCTDW